MIKLIRSLVLLVCVTCPAAAIAFEEDIYQIEIIFFEHTDSRRFDSEVWPKYVGKLNTTNTVRLQSLKSGVPENLDTLETLDALDQVGDEPIKKIIPQTIALVEPKSSLLNDEVAKIKHSKNQRFIQHAAWTQPLSQYVKSTSVFIQGGKDNREIQAVVNVKPNNNIYTVNVDLIYTTDHSTRQGVKEFKINKDFKVKRKEIFYVDHPVVGMLILVSPLVVDSNDQL